MKKPYQAPTIEFVYLGLPKEKLLSGEKSNPDVINVVQGSPVD
jgi:hypothetical protein